MRTSSSGIKRGLATVAVSALAVTGLPFLVNSASATPLSDQVSTFRILSQGGAKYANTVSLGSDGTNDTVSLVASGPAGVTTVQFQYSADGGTTYNNVGDPLTRNAHGVFTTEWNPAGVAAGTTVQIRAIRNGAEPIADRTVTDSVLVEAAGAGNPSIELATEGDLGMYRNIQTGTDNVAVSGTTSADPATNDVNVFDNDQEADNRADYGRVNGLTASEQGGVWRFDGVLTYPAASGYPFSSGDAPNQVALTASIDNAEDTEASTYYLQTVTAVTATAAQPQVPVGGDTDVTVKVLDQNGKPVAGATVGFLSPDGADAGADPDDNANAGLTNAQGEVTLADLGKGTYTAYVDQGTAGYQVADIEASPVTIEEYTPANTSLVASTVDGFSDFDVDELTGADDDLVATLEDQAGNPVVGEQIQYSYTFDPADGGAATTTDYVDAPVTNAAGESAIPFTDLGAGSYTLDVRRPNVGGLGLLQGQPVTFNVAESEIEWADGDSATSPINGSDTYTGRLALTDAGGAALAGRTVEVSWGPNGGDAVVSTTQPHGTTRDSGTTATAVTAADGTFSVTLDDPPPPPLTDPVAQDGVLTADATELSGPGDDADADARASLDVKFQEQAEVGRVEVDTTSLFSDYAPGKPAAVHITVYGEDGDTNPANDVELGDHPVTVSVDKGFLSPDADDVDDLVLADGHDAAGDLFGFYEQLGTSEDLTTADSGATIGETGIVAAIERDEDFDDDGLAQMEITVTAGDVTETETVTFDSRSYLNLSEVAVQRAADEAAGDVEVGDEVDFRLTARDQFGNLVGDQLAEISDDTAVAEVVTDGDFGATETDFANDNDGIRATSAFPVVQTLQARLQDVATTEVDAAGDPDADTRTVTESSAPINWVPQADDRRAINAKLKARTGKGNKDILIIRAPRAARGAKVVFYAQIDGEIVKVGKGRLNRNGDLIKRVRDRNGNQKTAYAAIVRGTSRTLPDTTNVRRVK